MKRETSGAALITALLVVAIASVAAVTMTMRDNQQVFRAATIQDQDRARRLTQGAETVALHMLERMENYDDLPWDSCVSPTIPLEVEGTGVRARLENLHCRFNVNSLARADDPPLDAFAGLVEHALGQTESSTGNAQRLAFAVHDWLNPETDDPVYRGMEPHRLSGNRPMRLASELLQVHGFSPDLWSALAPYVVARPGTDNAIDMDRAPDPVHAAGLDQATEETPEIRYFRLQLVVRIAGRDYFHCATLDGPNGRTIIREQTPCEP
ncbi:MULTISPECIES: general secretion pathway protein GspK [unclassified Thioalkalivibrio]|uniref:general secretion pathway protein GspK n=1 Tax=unclassified Thioalkalivibrio TaxID=2621013 RepID=UPI0003775701|nr:MULTISPECIES: type II secretion system protein GspK [unclassified Thioalkalivibrio]